MKQWWWNLTLSFLNLSFKHLSRLTISYLCKRRWWVCSQPQIKTIWQNGNRETLSHPSKALTLLNGKKSLVPMPYHMALIHSQFNRWDLKLMSCCQSIPKIVNAMPPRWSLSPSRLTKSLKRVLQSTLRTSGSRWSRKKSLVASYVATSTGLTMHVWL
jgi:hypothetical protein